MLEALSRGVFSILADSRLLARAASRYGMRRPDSFARRFVAGETPAEAIEAARALSAQGLGVIFDYLGEHVRSTDAATAATQEYAKAVAAIAQSGTGRDLSVKLSQLGIDVDRATGIDNLRRVVETAEKAGFFVRVDMEGSRYTGQTIDAFESLWQIGCRNIGIAIQAYLRRSPDDVDRMIALGASVRLVKGAYDEPKDVALQHKTEVDAAFVDLMKRLLERGVRPAIATHDPDAIEETTRFAEATHIARDTYTFEMLYGIRRDLQTGLAARGHVVRIYVPFGRQWFPYFMRRLGERPANLGFVVKSLFRDSDRG